MLVQVLREGLQRGKGIRYWGRTAHSRRRGGWVGWMEGKSSGILCGGLEGHVKALGGWSEYFRSGRMKIADVYLHCENEDDAVEGKGIYEQMYYSK